MDASSTLYALQQVLTSEREDYDEDIRPQFSLAIGGNIAHTASTTRLISSADSLFQVLRLPQRL